MTPVERVAQLLAPELYGEGDLSWCEYVTEGGTCSTGECQSEPACITSRPAEGWPSERLAPQLLSLLTDEESRKEAEGVVRAAFADDYFGSGQRSYLARKAVDALFSWLRSESK